MALKDFLAELDGAVETVMDSSFEIEIYDTKTVPRFDDSLLTWDNLDQGKKKCKRLESCVLYVDIRNSAALNVQNRAWTLARLYSVFVRSMVKAAKYHGGHVRNIIGDRVMVVFDQEKCFENAVNTAILMNSIAGHIINKRYADDFKCGIGIDYGPMLVTKAGEIRRGAETEFYRSLVWLGRPANIASRLTDIANKLVSWREEKVRVAFQFVENGEWYWYDYPYPSFLNSLEVVYPQTIKHKDEDFRSFYDNSFTNSVSYPPILMTEAVFQGFKAALPNDKTIVNHWWKEQRATIKEYDGKIYGGDIIFTQVNEL